MQHIDLSDGSKCSETKSVRRPAALSLLLVVFFFCSSARAVDDSRSAKSLEAERDSLELFSAGEYEKAIPILQRASAAEPKDLKIAGLLGMAYLYSSSNPDLAANFPRAQALLDQVVADGGEAVILVARGNDPLKSTAVHMVKVTQGELRIRKDSLTFVPYRTAIGGFGPLGPGEVRECAPNPKYGKDSNTFHLKLAKETVDLRPFHFSRDESDLVCMLTNKYLGTRN